MTQPRNTYTLAEFCTLASVDRTTVMRWIRNGVGPEIIRKKSPMGGTLRIYVDKAVAKKWVKDHV